MASSLSPSQTYNNDSAHVHVADFGFMEPVFSGSKAVRVNGDVRPSGDLLFETFQSSVHLRTSWDSSFDAHRLRWVLAQFHHTLTALDHDRTTGHVKDDSGDPRCFLRSKKDSRACHVFWRAEPP